MNPARRALLTVLISGVLISCSAICGSKQCDKSLCPETTSCNITTIDECDCCHVCVRTINEECGGAYGKLGVCQRGLECVNNGSLAHPFVGICKVHRDCARVRCAVPSVPHCPQDSLVKRGEVLPGECCPQPDLCVCDKCRAPPVRCGGVFGTRQLIAPSTDTPGHCCDLYECVDEAGTPDCASVTCPSITFDCPWDSKYVPSNETNANNSCCKIPGKCECDVTRCNGVECPPKHTKKLQSGAENLPGTCCDMYECVPDGGPSDVCVDPYTGLKYESGEYYRRDPCTPCTCFSGAPQCYNIPCPRISCRNPVKSETECCPTCPDVSQCGSFKCNLDCPKGFAVDERDCPMCHCKNSTSCDPLSGCSLWCPNGYKTSKDGCEECACHTCSDTMKHCTLSCGYGFDKDSRECPLCKCKRDQFGSTQPPERRRCYENGEVHENGATWHPNQCTSCTCYNGHAACSLTDCEHLLGCRNSVTLPGTCCPICKEGCIDSSKISRKESEVWSDVCKECSCNNGTVSCFTNSCPPLQCTEAVVVPGKCCPMCPTVMQNVVQEADQKYTVVIIVKQDLHTMMERQISLLKHLEIVQTLKFTISLLFSSDLRLLSLNSGSNSSGSIVLLTAIGWASKKPVLADKIVTQLERNKIVIVEPDILKILTYSDYLDLTSRTAATVSTASKINVTAIVAGAITITVIVAGVLIFYGFRRYLVLSHRRKFKHSASMGQSADQLINAVDTNRLTINFSRPPRQSIDSGSAMSSPTPSELSPAVYQPVRGHDNLASQYNPLSQVDTVPEADPLEETDHVTLKIS